MGVFVKKVEEKPKNKTKKYPWLDKGAVVDVIDFTDSLEMLDHEIATLLTSPNSGFARSDAQIVIDNPQDANAVDLMVRNVSASTSSVGFISLLRIHGHGAPGFQSLWGFKPAGSEEEVRALLKSGEDPNGRQVIGYWNLEAIRSSLSLLTRHFVDGGQVWLMGCEVAKGPAGTSLVDRLAKMLHVTVKASPALQYAGKGRQSSFTFLLESEIVTGRP